MSKIVKLYEVRHKKCNVKTGYMTEDNTNSIQYCKKCKNNFMIPKIFSSEDFTFKLQDVEIENMKEPEPEPINKYVNFESQSQSHSATYAQ
jgi:hypothetical protein